MDSSIDELSQDFAESLKKIDFQSYNPNSAEFLTALRLGQMLVILKGEETHESVPIKTAPVDDISEELDGARKYLQKYSDTKDPAFKEMAGDELKHANMLIKKAHARLPGNEEKARLKAYEDEVKAISEML